MTSPDAAFQIGSPIFDKVTIRLPQDVRKGEFVIEALNNSKQNIYIQSAWLNDKEDNGLRLPYAEFIKGGTLKLQMGAEPRK